MINKLKNLIEALINNNTFKYILKRVFSAIITLLIIIFILFILLKLMPGTPFNDERLTESQKALIYEKYGLDKPIYVQYFNYLKNMLNFDFGVSYSIQKNLPVATLIGPGMKISFTIGILAVIFGTFIGLILGVIAAIKRNTVWDTLATIFSVIGVSIPSFVFALTLLMLFGVKIPILPTIYDSTRPLYSSIIPVIALSMSVIANVARFTRSEMIEVLNSEYILLVKAKGINKRQIITKHALRNAIIPVITILAPILVALMTGSMVVETICSVPGLGKMLVRAITENDYNVVMAISFLYSMMYIVIMLLVDLSYGLIDPRIRLAKGGSHE